MLDHTKNTEMAEVLNTLFAFVFTNTFGPQALRVEIQVDANPPTVKEELVRELL